MKRSSSAAGPRRPPASAPSKEGVRRDSELQTDTPLANPVFFSDVPSFLQRQRARAARALASEHTFTVTCPCPKCDAEARRRADEQPWRSWRATQQQKASAHATTSVASMASERTGDQRVGCGAERDFVWLLRVVQDVCGTPRAGAPTSGPPEGTPPDRRHWSDVFGTGAAKAFQPSAPSTHWLKRELGVKIPETVILEKGKPKRRYHMDSEGLLQAASMKTSAELLRVLRDFVRRAGRPRLPAAGGAEPPRLRRASRAGFPAAAGLPRARSEGRLRSCSTGSGLAHVAADGAPCGLGRAPAPLTDAAVLNYVDGTVRLMSTAEAQVQMKDAGKLPREFWQHIRSLQVPVQSAQAGVPTRYVTYAFDARSAACEPQQPLPLSHLRHPGHSQGRQHDLDSSRVSSVPRKINKWLAGRRKGQRGFGLQLVSGQFEFVHDLADDSLWLVNASQLRCMRTEASAEESDGEQEDVDIRYFNEDEFTDVLRQEKQKLDEMKRHYDRTTTMEKSRGALMHVDTMMGTLSFSLSERDVLSGMSELPQDLVKYTEAHGFMKRFYKDELFPCAESAANRSSSQTKAVGLSTWFQRWVKAHRKSLRG